MMQKYSSLFLIFSLIFGSLNAQPDENYIKKLVGMVSQEWLMSVGSSLSMKQADCSIKKTPGFNGSTPEARKQLQLSTLWNFYGVDTSGNVSIKKEVQLPHHFATDRNYRSGWYLSKFHLNKDQEDRCFLMLSRVQMFSMIYVNGHRCGTHFGGFTPFETEITNALVPGENVVAIFVYDQSASVDRDKAYNQLGTTRLASIYNPTSAKELPGGIDCVPFLEMRGNAFIKDIFVKTSTRKGELEIEYEFPSNSEFFEDSKLSFDLYIWPNGEKADLEIPSILLNKSTKGINSCKVKWINPKLWSPEHPNLYVLRTTLKNGAVKDVIETRFGFREFWKEGQSFILNGVPIRLRGESIYEPIRNGVDFHREVFNMHKTLFGSNACRLHAFMPPGDVVLGADEAGMLLDDQSAIWSTNAAFYRNGGDWFLKNTEKEFEEWVRRDRNSPSVVIWDVENEMLRISFDLHLPWVSKLPGFIKKLDNTRLINNSGAGWFSPDQDMAWLHMQEHYSKIMSDWKSKGTFPLVMGEFWVGGRQEDRLPNSPELITANQSIIEEARSYEEKMIEMRNVGVSGVMPFRISRAVFEQIPHSANGYQFTPPNRLEVRKKSDQAIQIIRHGLQPITVFFWPRQNYAVEGRKFKKEIVVCNDKETVQSFNVSWKWENQTVKSKTITLQPTAQQRIVINEEAPVNPSKLIATVSNRDGVISSDTLLINPVIIPKINIPKNIHVYNDTNLAGILAKEGFNRISSDKKVPELTENAIWIFPEHANNRELNGMKDKILQYLKIGGAILCLKQDQSPTWFPVKFQFWSANQTSPHNYAMMGWEGLNKNLFFSTIAPVYATAHPIFNGMNTPALTLWNKFDGRVSDDLFVRPSAVNKFEQGNWRPLAGGTRIEHISLAEIFYGKGALLSCQLNVMDNLDNVQAKVLFINMLNYLSGINPTALSAKIVIKGDINADDLSGLTGVTSQIFEGAVAQNHDLLIASDGAEISEIKDWAAKGGRALVFSDSLSQLFDGSVVNGVKMNRIAKLSDHPMFNGVCSANFTNDNMTIFSGCFTALPTKAKSILIGFGSDNISGPVVASLPYGKGEIILSTIRMKNMGHNLTRELLCLVLTNCGVQIPYNQTSTYEIVIKKTVPVIVDGKLNEWLEDMEDRLVTQYIHAQPVYLTSESIVEGPPEFDLNLSAIDYFMWNEHALHIAGVVFKEDKTFESGINFGSKKEYKMDILFNDDIITISFINNELIATVNGRNESGVAIKGGQLSSKKMTDAAVLQFDFIHKSGKITSVEHLTGETFEMTIPWKILKSKATDRTSRALITLESKGSKLQVPLSALTKSKESWLTMRIKNNLKY